MILRDCCVALLLCTALPAAAQDKVRREIHKCEEDGKVTYSNAPCSSAALRQDSRIDNKPVIVLGRNNGSKNPVIDWGEKSARTSAAESVGVINWGDAGSIARAVTSTRDAAKGLTQFEAPVLAREEHDRLFLRASAQDGNRDPAMQIYVRSVFRGGWRRYAEAADAGGGKLALTPIATDEDCGGSYGCTLAEDVGVEVTRAYLEASRDSGVGFQIIGPGGRQQYLLPPAYVQGFLQAVPPVVRGEAAAGAAPK